MTDTRPVHAPSPSPHQKGYTACGRKMRSHVKTTDLAHHVTCSRCSSIVTNQTSGGNPTLHLVGFRGEEYWSARKIWWDLPVMIHRVHDRRMQRDVGENDVVVFANSEREDVLREFNGDDVRGYGYTD